MAKQVITPTTAWVANSTDPYADQSYKNGDRDAGLSAPANFNASGGDTVANLSWDSVATATDYEVRIDAGSWVSTSNATSYQFTGLTNAVEYDFDVRATTATEDGPLSSDTATPAVGGAGNIGFTPIINMNAENSTVGQTYEGTASDQWTDSAGETYGTQAEVFEGAKAFEMNIRDDAPSGGGFGTWGGRKSLPSDVGKGGSLVYQTSVYFPAAFDWTVTGAGNRLKFMRISTVTAAAANRGYHDIYIDNAATHGAGNDGRLRQVFEGVGSGMTIDGENLSKDTWETVEFRIDFDDVSVDGGGDGRIRIWRNKAGVMVKILDRTDIVTLQDATDVCPAVLLFTYWNGTLPAQQHMYSDRIVVHDDPTDFVNLDSEGTPVIGGVS